MPLPLPMARTTTRVGLPRGCCLPHPGPRAETLVSRRRFSPVQSNVPKVAPPSVRRAARRQGTAEGAEDRCATGFEAREAGVRFPVRSLAVYGGSWGMLATRLGGPSFRSLSGGGRGIGHKQGSPSAHILGPAPPPQPVPGGGPAAPSPDRGPGTGNRGPGHSPLSSTRPHVGALACRRRRTRAARWSPPAFFWVRCNVVTFRACSTRCPASMYRACQYLSILRRRT
jgi:hypothetical protein